jgi:hypothetical protein
MVSCDCQRDADEWLPIRAIYWANDWIPRTVTQVFMLNLGGHD